MDKITVTITPEGATQVRVDGVKGGACQDLTADLEKKLGKVTSDVETPEMREKETRVTVGNRA